MTSTPRCTPSDRVLPVRFDTPVQQDPACCSSLQPGGQLIAHLVSGQLAFARTVMISAGDHVKEVRRWIADEYDAVRPASALAAPRSHPSSATPQTSDSEGKAVVHATLLKCLAMHRRRSASGATGPENAAFERVVRHAPALIQDMALTAVEAAAAAYLADVRNGADMVARSTPRATTRSGDVAPAAPPAVDTHPATRAQSARRRKQARQDTAARPGMAASIRNALQRPSIAAARSDAGPVEPETSFLDSSDDWEPTHLAQREAVQALAPELHRAAPCSAATPPPAYTSAATASSTIASRKTQGEPQRVWPLEGQATFSGSDRPHSPTQASPGGHSTHERPQAPHPRASQSGAGNVSNNTGGPTGAALPLQSADTDRSGSDAPQARARNDDSDTRARGGAADPLEASVAPLLLHQRLSSTRALERFRNHVGLMAMLRRGVGEVLDMYEDRCAAAAAQLGGGMHGSSQRITVCMIACLHDELRSRRA